MTSRSIAALAVTILASCSPRKASPPKPTDSVTLETSRCYGFCPAYRLSVFADGRVDFAGSAYAVEHASAQIDTAAAQTLLRRFSDSRFAALDSDYTEHGVHCGAYATDGSSYTLSLHSATTRHVVTYYGHCAPDPTTPRGKQDRSDYDLLKSLTLAMDSAANAKQWFRPPPARK